jgi:hypothetical protein
MKSRRRRDRGDICQLRVELWAGIRAASGMLEAQETTPELKLRAVSALATAASVYAKLLEAKPDDDVKPEPPGDVIVIHSATGSNGHRG